MLAGAAALAITTGIIVGGGTAAYAAVTPAWENDPNALGSLTFYDATGAAITGGSTEVHPAAVYAQASGPGRPGDSLAQLWLATPKVGVNPLSWSKDVFSAATAYPNNGAPANIKNSTLPVSTSTNTDFSIADYLTEFPNTINQAGYTNLYEFRVYTSSPSQLAGVTYYRTDIQVDPVAKTWTVVFPAPATATSTTLTATPTSPQPHGTAVTLKAHVSPAAAGGVHFFDGATDLGAGSYNATTGDATLTTTPADGNHTFKAQFTSTDPAFSGSTSPDLAYSIAQPTSTTLTASPTSPAPGDASGNASVTLTANVTPTGLAGGVHFFDGTTDLGAGSYTPGTGVATLTSTLDAAHSPHQLVATFTPTNTTFGPSTSLVLSYSVVPPNFGTAGIPVNATDNTPPFAGSLVLQVAAGTKVDLTQVDPTTPAGHPVQATDPTGHRHAWVFTGGLSGVSVQDTRPDQFGWTLNGQASDFAGPTAISAKNLGWAPALVGAGSDAEGTVNAGASVDSILKTKTSNGLSVPSTQAKAGAGNGLGTQNLSASRPGPYRRSLPVHPAERTPYR
ncbi:MAG: hypothetical protein AUI14_08710 [Actinobacteria bacterium 13_2_20CM_2_71_6]|nr:MAG: hypothetical protein AUI14_08710 [Actinobacteria bacterium 13_2_20CM_2_71_6]